MLYLQCWRVFFIKVSKDKVGFSYLGRVELEVPSLVVFLATVKYMDFPLYGGLSSVQSVSSVCYMYLVL